MKKFTFILMFTIMALTAFAQKGEKYALFKVGYQTDFKRLGVGADWRYFLSDNLRLAPDAMLFFPKDKAIGFDINANVHYLIPMNNDDFSYYPLVGFNMANNHVGTKRKNGHKVADSYSDTSFGFNIGCGIEYQLGISDYLNAQFQYTFNRWDYAIFSVGYGYEF